jgi:hypothetical protein
VLRASKLPLRTKTRSTISYSTVVHLQGLSVETPLCDV